MGENGYLNPQVLGLNSEPMEEFRRTMDDMLKMLLVNLTERGLETGTMTAKVKLTLEHNGENTMLKIEPDVNLKIGAKGAKKCRTQQGIFVFYDDKGEPFISGSQMGMVEYLRNRDEEERKGAG